MKTMKINSPIWLVADPSPWRPGFIARPVHLALRQVFLSRVLWFLPVIIIATIETLYYPTDAQIYNS